MEKGNYMYFRKKYRQPNWNFEKKMYLRRLWMFKWQEIMNKLNLIQLFCDVLVQVYISVKSTKITLFLILSNHLYSHIQYTFYWYFFAGISRDVCIITKHFFY